MSLTVLFHLLVSIAMFQTTFQPTDFRKLVSPAFGRFSGLGGTRAGAVPALA
jgi:hypothetical protein